MADFCTPLHTDTEIDAVFRATSWRVIHTDGFTPDAFLARLALNDFEERPVTIQMALQGELTDRGAPIELRPVVSQSLSGTRCSNSSPIMPKAGAPAVSKVPPEVTLAWSPAIGPKAGHTMSASR